MCAVTLTLDFTRFVTRSATTLYYFSGIATRLAGLDEAASILRRVASADITHIITGFPVALEALQSYKDVHIAGIIRFRHTTKKDCNAPSTANELTILSNITRFQ